MNYNERNSHPRDAALRFDCESHTYTLGGRVLRSVTTLVEDQFERFDAPYWAARKAIPPQTPEQLMQLWEDKAREARDLGTLMHDRIERYYLGELADDEGADDSTFRHFLAFAAHHRLQPYRTEWRIYLEECGLAGTLDFLAIGDDGQFEIWDWKRSSKLIGPDGRPITDNRYGKRALGRLANVPDCTYWHYALQVSIYRYILERKYGISPVRARLGVFHPDHSTYHIVPLPYLEREVQALLPL